MEKTAITTLHAGDIATLATLPIAEVESAMLQHEQVDSPVIHRFGPGIYIREVSLPAGTLAIGHEQRHEHMNVFLKGRVTMLNEDGTTTELVAPMVFVGKPGRKIGYINEDMVWQNIYATNETDIEKLEAMYLNKSDGWQEDNAIKEAALRMERQEDREDFEAMLKDVGVTAELVREQSENLADQIDFPLGGYKCMVSESYIEGKGMFATADIAPFEVIAPARISGFRTPAGRYTNHSAKPNAAMVLSSNGDIFLVATKKLSGCKGGQKGDEITIDYRQAVSLSLEG